MKQILRIMLISIGISLSTSYIFMTLSIGDYAMTQDDLIKQIYAAIICGVIIGIATLIFYYTTWSFIIQTLCHFSIVTSTVIIIGYYAQWYELIRSEFLLVLLNIVVVYIVIWLMVYYFSKSEVQEINEALKKRKEEKDT